VTAALLATAFVLAMGVLAAWYLASVRRRPRSVGSDVAHFRASMDALAPSANERPLSPGGTMGESPGADR
jgi:hypothetical protein